MNGHDQDDQHARMKMLLRQALPPMNSGDGPKRDLWPDVLRRMDVNSGASVSPGWAWFDGALAAGIVGLVAIFPAVIPMFLYYL